MIVRLELEGQGHCPGTLPWALPPADGINDRRSRLCDSVRLVGMVRSAQMVVAGDKSKSLFDSQSNRAWVTSGLFLLQVLDNGRSCKRYRSIFIKTAACRAWGRRAVGTLFVSSGDRFSNSCKGPFCWFYATRCISLASDPSGLLEAHSARAKRRP